MKLKRYPENKRLTKSQIRNRLFLGLTTLGLTIGALGLITNSQRSTQKVARQFSSFSLSKNSLLNEEKKGLKTTSVYCPTFWWLGFGECHWVDDSPKPSLEDRLYNNRMRDAERRLKNVEKRLNNHDKKLSDLQSQIDELKGIRANTEKTNKHLEDIKKILKKKQRKSS